MALLGSILMVIVFIIMIFGVVLLISDLGKKL